MHVNVFVLSFELELHDIQLMILNKPNYIIWLPSDPSLLKLQKQLFLICSWGEAKAGLFQIMHVTTKYTNYKLIYYERDRPLTLLLKSCDQFSDGVVRWRHCLPLQHTCATGYNRGCGLLCFWWVNSTEIQTHFAFFITLTEDNTLITLMMLSMSFLPVLLRLKWVTAWSKTAHCEALEACLFLYFWLWY